MRRPRIVSLSLIGALLGLGGVGGSGPLLETIGYDTRPIPDLLGTFLQEPTSE
jgi:hypothetical protein